MRVYSRGDLYYVNLNPVVGAEQAGYRPVLIVQNNTGNRYGRTVIVASLSCQLEHKPKLPPHCYLQAGDALKKTSVVLLEQLRTIDKQRLSNYIGSLDQNCMEKVDHALAVSVGLSEKWDA